VRDLLFEVKNCRFLIAFVTNQFRKALLSGTERLFDSVYYNVWP